MRGKPMKDKIRLDFTNTEKATVMKSLNLLRNNLAAQGRTTDSIDEIILAVNEYKTELDICDIKIIINALNTMRYKLKSANQPRDNVNYILLKMIEKVDKKTINFKEAYER